MKQIVLILCVGVALLTAGNAVPAEPSKGQLVYVPAYSHIFGGDREHPFYLTVTLSIRNVNLEQGIFLESVAYYDSKGNRVREYLDEPERLLGLESRYFVVKESDKTGGVGAHFIVRWSATSLVSPPIIQAVMIGTRSQQGISFTTSGRAITAGDQSHSGGTP